MSRPLFSLDTNILIYTIDLQAGEKHLRARKILEQAVKSQACVLTLQSLCEFCAATTRKGKLSHAQATDRARAWQALFPVVARTPDCLMMAMDAVESHSLSFWDALLWATVRESGVRVLLTEDFQDGRTLGGVLFRNPFIVDDPFREPSAS